MNTPETGEDRERLVSSLGIPADARAPSRYIANGSQISGPALAALVDDDVALRTWRRWNPAQTGRLARPAFHTAFAALLSAGAGMGYSLDRFRSACQSLPDPDLDGDAWVELFERAVAARNALDLRVHVRPEVRESWTKIQLSKDTKSWNTLVKQMSDDLFYELGIVLPRLELVADGSLDMTELRIEINDARLPRYALLPPDHLLVNDTADRLKLLNILGEQAVNPANGSECAIVAASDAEICEQAGLTTWDRAEYAILSISAVARRMAGAFINRYLVDFYAERLAEAFPRVIEEMNRAMTHDGIAQVLRSLVDEEISIRNLLRIFEVLTLPEASIVADLARDIVFSPAASNRSQFYRSAGRAAPALQRRLFRVRSSMARYITHKYTRGSNTLTVYLLDGGLEKRLAHPRPFSRCDHSALLRALREEIDNPPPTIQNRVILTVAPVRLRLRREIAAVFPRTAVLAYQELSPDVNIQPIGRIEDPFTQQARAERRLSAKQR
jgi:type III secretory pathway component EscV